MTGKGHIEIVKKLIMQVYHWMQHHYLTFRVLVWLKEMGITRKISFILQHSNDKELLTNPTEEMLRSQRWFDENRKRMTNVLDILEDDISRDVWRSVMEYRTKRVPISGKYYSENDQYFCRDIIMLKNEEVFVDGGGYTGDTIQQLLDTARKAKVKIKRIIAFEPSIENYEILNKFYGKKKNTVLINKGLSNREEILYFCEQGVSSKLTEDVSQATTKVSVVNIDAIPECREATFIKMDIEGAELDALEGARETILKNHPILAICIYHSDEDMLRIIEYIHDLVPEYKLYVRHHSKSHAETVVYAVINREASA